MQTDDKQVRRKMRLMAIGLGVTVLALMVVSGVLMWRWSMAKPDNGSGVATERRIILKVSKLIELPAGEKPTVAQISDKEAVKDQPFFKNVQNGDYLIIYEDSEIALLYREGSNKLIKVGNITINLKTRQEEPLR